MLNVILCKCVIWYYVYYKCLIRVKMNLNEVIFRNIYKVKYIEKEIIFYYLFFILGIDSEVL